MFANFATNLVKMLGSLITGVGGAFLVVGIFALNNPERWEAALVGRHGPPLGPTLLAVGVGMLTTTFLLVVLFWRGWRRKAIERSFLRGHMVKVLASLCGGVGTGLVVYGCFLLNVPSSDWEFQFPQLIRDWDAALKELEVELKMPHHPPDKLKQLAEQQQEARKHLDHWRHSSAAVKSLGPVLLAVGIGFLSSSLLMAMLFWMSGRLPPAVPAPPGDLSAPGL